MIGAGVAGEATLSLAEEVGRRLAEAGCSVVNLGSWKLGDDMMAASSAEEAVRLALAGRAIRAD